MNNRRDLEMMTMSAMQKGLAPPRSAAAVRAVVGFSGLALALFLTVAAAILWIYYGTAVFFEMIASGIAACF